VKFSDMVKFTNLPPLSLREYNETVGQLYMDSNKTSDSVGREVFYNILREYSTREIIQADLNVYK
jgi:hypothetical protein